MRSLSSYAQALSALEAGTCPAGHPNIPEAAMSLSREIHGRDWTNPEDRETANGLVLHLAILAAARAHNGPELPQRRPERAGGH